jgi:hypothetical protein
MNKNWFITRAQIAEGKVDDALSPVDPAVILTAEIFGLAGAVRLRVEDVAKPADLFANPQNRAFFQELHENWPWGGYFLRLHLITSKSPEEHIIDMGMFMALLLCRVDEITYFESDRGVTLRFNGDQFKHHLDDLRQRAAALASLTGIPEEQIQQRDDLIVQAVASFFAAGQSLQQPSKPRPKK